jgi:hypothetical protein
MSHRMAMPSSPADTASAPSPLTLTPATLPAWPASFGLAPACRSHTRAVQSCDAVTTNLRPAEDVRRLGLSLLPTNRVESVLYYLRESTFGSCLTAIRGILHPVVHCDGQHQGIRLPCFKRRQSDLAIGPSAFQ